MSGEKNFIVIESVLGNHEYFSHPDVCDVTAHGGKRN